MEHPIFSINQKLFTSPTIIIKCVHRPPRIPKIVTIAAACCYFAVFPNNQWMWNVQLVLGCEPFKLGNQFCIVAFDGCHRLRTTWFVTNFVLCARTNKPLTSCLLPIKFRYRCKAMEDTKFHRFPISGTRC